MRVDRRAEGRGRPKASATRSRILVLLRATDGLFCMRTGRHRRATGPAIARSKERENALAARLVARATGRGAPGARRGLRSPR